MQPQLPPALPSVSAPALPLELSIERAGPAKLPPGAPFLISSIRIIGNSTFETSVLIDLVATARGQRLTLAQLGLVTGLIRNYYQEHGYPLVRVVIPPQVIRDGAVTI